MTLTKSETACQRPSTLFSARQQCFCCYQACALPCDKHLAPSTLAVCGLVLYPKKACGCAKKLSDIPHQTLTGGAPLAAEAAVGAPDAPDAPAAEGMGRR